jgi:sugar/nucleoside kinase (ribokinase family)
LVFNIFSLSHRYGAQPGTACLAEEKHLPLYDELVRDYDVKYIAGGAGQNSMRACQWMAQLPNSVGYIGSIGKDKNGDILRDAAVKDGVTPYYHVDPTTPTGTCACLIHEKERYTSLVYITIITCISISFHEFSIILIVNFSFQMSDCQFGSSELL